MEEKSRPHVTMFGNDVSGGHSHHRATCRGCDKSSNAVVGVLFLGAGFLLLCNTLGILPWWAWHYVWQFWPLMLVFLGVSMILGDGFVGRVFSAVVAICAVGFVLLYILDVTGSPMGMYVDPDVMYHVRMMETMPQWYQANI